MGYRGHVLLKKLLGGHVPPVPPWVRRLCNRSIVLNFFFILFLVNRCCFFPVFRTHTFCRDDKHIHFNRKKTGFPYNCSLRSLRTSLLAAAYVLINVLSQNQKQRKYRIAVEQSTDC